MQVVRVAWVGTRTDQFTDTTHFFREVLGLSTVHQEADFAILQLPSGDRDFLEIFGADAEGKEFEAEHYVNGPVPGFLVTDLVEARAELAAAGVELLDEISWPKSIPGYGWFHFRAPDGNVYAMLQGST
ncbi:MAG TPA: VOC family protein [Candidatus Limnocylindria bacterium]